MVSMLRTKDQDLLTPSTVSSLTLQLFTRNSTYIVEYQQGFLTYNYPNLYSVSYAKGFLTSSLILKVADPLFIVFLREKGGTQLVYILCQNRIIIKENYATNYQTLNITQSLIAGLTLSSYAMSERILTLLYEGKDHYLQLVYDLAMIYPKLIDSFHHLLVAQGSVSLLSVHNFLQTGSFYLLIDHTTSTLNLTYYDGYQLRITPTH